jgi:hypothetical protein
MVAWFVVMWTNYTLVWERWEIVQKMVLANTRDQKRVIMQNRKHLLQIVPPAQNHHQHLHRTTSKSVSLLTLKDCLLI